MVKTWIEISKTSLINNYNQFRKIVPKKKIMGILKSNAYGHGLREISNILNTTDIDWFGIDSPSEALELKNLKIKKPMLVLGYTTLEEIKLLIENDVSFTVYDLEHIQKIIDLKLNRVAKIHLKIDTGMHRQGISNNQIDKYVEVLKQNEDKLLLEGVSTHFADVKNPPDFGFTKTQIEKFLHAREVITKSYQNVIFHSAATAGTMLYKETHLDMVRVGIGLYGYWPAEEVKNYLSENLKLEPVLTWKSIVAQIKEIEKGESVSYSRTWIAEKFTKIAIIPVGYYDGFDRGLSNVGHVLIDNKKMQVLGRVCMNMIIVDVTGVDVKVEDEVIVIGKGNTAEEIAQKIDTISYEVLARLNPKIPKIIN